MNRKEQLRNHIEKERTILNRLLAGGANVEEIYAQSRVVDALIEQYEDVK
ncbi:MAG TPA: hypothetical protein IAB97_01780 [Candidatus Choladousia intestinipullorum]|nr:hypothetical protein [Candidatus Choladousia intestinipullorum]